MSHDEQNPQAYIFWLFDWNVVEVAPMVQLRSRYILCKIDANQIVIGEQPTALIIPFTHILECHKATVSQTRGITSENVRVVLNPKDKITKGWFTRSEIYLLPEFIHDIENLFRVITDYKAGNIPSIHPNPYYRLLEKQDKLNDFSEEKWNALVPPYVYFPLPTAGKVVKYALQLILGVIIATFVVIAGIVGLDYLIHLLGR